MSRMSSDLMFCQKDIVNLHIVCVCVRVCVHSCHCMCVCVRERRRECFLSSAVASHHILCYDFPRSQKSSLS